MYLIIIFILIILILISRLNLLIIIFWWDLLGLVSFLLIIYYNNYIIIKIRILVILFNRLGDILIFIILFYFFSFSDSLLFFKFNFNTYLFFIFRFFIKRSQFPLNLWLTKAIVAPLPISSLVHSSTLVTVGVYFIFRYLVYLNFEWIEFYLIIRVIYYSLIIIFIFDIKKLIAISTINNLSLIIFFLIIYLYIYMFIYIIIHAIFKSIIFLCIGLLIYNNYDIQDVRIVIRLFQLDFLLIYLFVSSILISRGLIYFSMFICKDLFFDLIYIVKLNNFFFSLIYLKKIFKYINDNFF